MENRFYTIRYPAIRKYDIDQYSSKLVLEQAHADDAFINKLVRVANTTKGSKKSINEFLAYQCENSQAAKIEFLDHTESIFKKNEYKLKAYSLAIGHVYDWINTEKKNSVINKSKSKRKSDPDFDKIIKNKEKFNSVFKILKSKNIIDEDFTWNGSSERGKKLELIALIEILKAEKIIEKKSKALLGRIFCKKFNCEMNPRNFSVTIKADTIALLRKELQL